MMGGDNKKAYKIYRQYMKKNDDCFSVVKTAHKSKWGDLQLTAYQMNNSLPTTEEKTLKPITEQAVRIIEELKKPDDITYLKYLDWKKDDFNINEVMCALVEWNSDFRKTELFRTKKSKDINRLVDNFAEGRLPQQGDNLTICGNPIVEESKKYNDTVKILASSKRKGRLEDDELYKLKRRQMELFLRKASKNLDQITIIQLVNHALMDSNSDVMGTLLNFLYFNYREKFLNCFVENS